MLAGGFSAVLEVRNRDEFRDEIARFTRRLGFNTFSAMTVLDRGVGQSEFIRVDNPPPAYAEPYIDPTAFRRDPVMQHCKHHSRPIVWDQATYVDSGAADLWEQQASHGYNTGVAMALHLPEGRHFLLGVDRDQALPADPAELQRLVADLQLFAVYAQEAAWRVLLPEAAKAAASRPLLTPRELEALRWTREGKTAWEVGAILHISERTAVMHVNNAMRKLDCNSKYLAVLKALRLGLIQ